METGKILLGILAGVATGAILGVLFAPDKGSNTRKKIGEKSEDLKDSLKEKFEEYLDNVSQKYENIKENASDFADNFKTAKDDVIKDFQRKTKNLSHQTTSAVILMEEVVFLKIYSI